MGGLVHGVHFLVWVQAWISIPGLLEAKRIWKWRHPNRRHWVPCGIRLHTGVGFCPFVGICTTDAKYSLATCPLTSTIAPLLWPGLTLTQTHPSLTVPLLWLPPLAMPLLHPEPIEVGTVYVKSSNVLPATLMILKLFLTGSFLDILGH